MILLIIEFNSPFQHYQSRNQSPVYRFVDINWSHSVSFLFVKCSYSNKQKLFYYSASGDINTFVYLYVLYLRVIVLLIFVVKNFYHIDDFNKYKFFCISTCTSINL